MAAAGPDKPPPTGPQTAKPDPAPPNARSDTPGGSASDGEVRPPPTGDSISKGPPPASDYRMPVIPPPSKFPSSRPVVPK
jgi:hypothetical protein